ncbi:hypothetical protein HKCCE2091_07625 [Rhodobacterales bacterium HKCCE2091]|nr:hypothetical protein [Rhodobacterales bacterium HKCCE2091]
MPRALRALVLAVPLAAAAAIAALAEIPGTYLAYGRNADGSAYQGNVTVTQTGANQYRVDWNVGYQYSGNGVLEGRVLTVHWGDANPAVYVLMPDGEFHGTWADGEGLEYWTRTPR